MIGGFEQEPVVRQTTDWESPDWDDLGAVQVWALERREYLAAVLAARSLSLAAGRVVRRPSWRAVAV